MGIYDDVLGTKSPGATEGQKEPKYSHWCNPGKGAGDFSADKNAFASGGAGMKGKENPNVSVNERERGDPPHANTHFEAKEFDVNQYDKE